MSLKCPIFFPGVFRPPVNGVYQLTFYGLVAGTDGGHVFIKSNDDILCKAWLSGNDNADTATCTAIAKLTRDDSVRVTGKNDYPSTLTGGSFSGFNGFLIYDS